MSAASRKKPSADLRRRFARAARTLKIDRSNMIGAIATLTLAVDDQRREIKQLQTFLAQLERLLAAAVAK